MGRCLRKPAADSDPVKQKHEIEDGFGMILQQQAPDATGSSADRSKKKKWFDSVHISSIKVKVLTKMSSKVPSSNNIAHARRAVQQLRIEANIERIKVSKASADLMHYCGEHAKYDPLLMGIPASENPFKDKKPCTIL
ncbi:hypothetical protein Z043_100958 [Scleropages formosus]|uniref:Guanine nucleotide-binding protein subunit gamma n=1 Tax=Scleropages formosus TaxID=113540 RepID=A0A0P7VZF4_SCLFO|nr:hypothetical protein Z043_100958 [Scleropages formosus]